MLSSTSSLSSASPGSLTNPNITRTYKQASSLFLTRRIPEALQTLEPIIQPQLALSSSDSARADADGLSDHDAGEPASEDNANGTNDTGTPSASSSSLPPSDAAPLFRTQAPIATASRGARVKVWSLYISMLNSIVEMTPDEGRKAFGTMTRWKELVKNVRDGDVWEDVARWGYSGKEGAVDADVVGNLATLLLAHAPSQKVTQSRLETYLASTSGIPSASALASHIERSSASVDFSTANGHSHSHTNGAGAQNNGTSTPRDLGSRLKILEIYALHVLPRNEEWDYAKDFINMSEVLDEERREAFVNALEGLREEHTVEGRKQKELEAQRQREREAEEERAARDKEAAEARLKERDGEEQRQQQQQRKQQSSKSSGTGSGSKSMKEGIDEVDYGVDKRRPNGTSKGSKQIANGAATASSSAAKGSSTQRNSATGPATKKSSRPPPPTLYRRMTLLFAALQQSLLNLGVNVSKHPVAVMRMLLFLFALVMALARQDVRQRITNARNTAWDKIKKTVGMGVKVSYV